MNSHCSCWSMFIALVLGMAAMVGAADPKNNRPEERREAAQARQAKEQARQAEEKQDAARRQLRQAQAEAAEAHSRNKQSVQQVKQLREELQEKHESASGASQARQAHQAAKAELDRLSAPLLAALRQRSDYQTAVKAADEARARLRLVADDKTLSEDARAAQAKSLSQKTLEPDRMERAAIDAEPQARRAREKLDSAAEAVASAVKKLEQLVDGDPQLRRALAELEKTAAAEAAADKRADAAQRQVLQAAEQVRREQVQLNELLRKQRLDDLRDRKRRSDDDPKRNKGKK